MDEQKLLGEILKRIVDMDEQKIGERIARIEEKLIALTSQFTNHLAHHNTWNGRTWSIIKILFGAALGVLQVIILWKLGTR